MGVEDNPARFIAIVRYWKKEPYYRTRHNTKQNQKSFSNREDAEAWLDNFRNNDEMVIRYKTIKIETIGERLSKARERAGR